MKWDGLCCTRAFAACHITRGNRIGASIMPSCRGKWLTKCDFVRARVRVHHKHARDGTGRHVCVCVLGDRSVGRSVWSYAWFFFLNWNWILLGSAIWRTVFVSRNHIPAPCVVKAALSAFFRCFTSAFECTVQCRQWWRWWQQQRHAHNTLCI